MTPYEIFYETISSYSFKKRTKLSGSMVELLYPNSLQSFAIQMGNCIEKCFKNYILSKKISLQDTIEINNETRQADLYFKLNEKTYYFEIKNNINLDTEKTKEVLEKIECANVDVKGVLTFRFDTEKNSFIKKSFSSYVFGYNDFFKMFDEKIDKEEYKNIICLLKSKYEE